jgi:hypothetical protein
MNSQVFHLLVAKDAFNTIPHIFLTKHMRSLQYLSTAELCQGWETKYMKKDAVFAFGSAFLTLEAA